MYAGPIAVEERVLVEFSFYANSMEGSDGFCVDYSLDVDDGGEGGDSSEAAAWITKRCYRRDGDDFVNGMWYDAASVVFDLRRDHPDAYDSLDGFRVRFRLSADGWTDDVLIGGVRILGGKDGVEVKDSML